jgi:hypothetical protein
MQMRQYLNEYLNRRDNIPNTSIEVYHYKTPQSEIAVEYSPETDKADIIHITRDRRTDYYEASNAKELKDTIEFCLGPLVSDIQWNQANTANDNLVVLEHEFDEF